MQQASAKKVFSPPTVSNREFKQEKLPPTEDYRERLFALEEAGEPQIKAMVNFFLIIFQ